MGKFKDITGQKFGKLTVIKRVGKNKVGRYLWKCQCDCGKETVTTANNLARGKTKTCGCQKQRELTGQKFGRLTAVECVGRNKHSKCLWKCRCDCGNETVVSSNQLTRGITTSCGCYRTETRTTHGLTKTKAFNIWQSMKNRCCNPKAANYKYYGGRGIKVCDEWVHDVKAFYDYVSKLPHYDEKGYSLDRIDNNGNYEPGNVRWATATEQRFNQRPKKRTKKIDINIQISFLDE